MATATISPMATASPLIRGMPPSDLAAEIIEGDGEEQEETVRFLLPASMFGAVGTDPATTSESREQHDALMALPTSSSSARTTRCSAC